MSERFLRTADEMLDKYIALEKAFMWEHNLTKHFVAFLYTVNHKSVDKETLKNAIDVINQETGVFSYYRGTYRFMLAGLLSIESSSIEGLLGKILQNEQALKNVGFKNGMHLPLASYALYKVSGDLDNNRVAGKAFEIYQMMKKSHPWLTSSDDYAMSVLLASSACELDRIEQIYQRLVAAGFSKCNELQRLSHILALSNRPVEEVSLHCTSLRDQLKANKLTVYSSFYAALGTVTLISLEEPALIADWIALSLYLNKQKKFKWLGKGMNILLASAIISDEWIKETTASEVAKISLSISIESLIAAQTAALIAAISASIVASNAAATS